jgi:hypothetical protein
MMITSGPFPFCACVILGALVGLNHQLCAAGISDLNLAHKLVDTCDVSSGN